MYCFVLYMCYFSLYIHCVVGCRGCWRNKRAIEDPEEELAKIRETLNFTVTAVKINAHKYEFKKSPNAVQSLLEYNIGDVVRAECNKTFTEHKLQWYQKTSASSIVGKIPTCDKNSCLLEMALELFDNNTILTCIVNSNDGRHVYKNSDEFTLRLRERDIDISHVTGTEVEEELASDMFQCNLTSPSTFIGVYGQDFLTYETVKVEMKAYKIGIGTRVFCLNYNCSNSLEIRKRTLNTYTLFIASESNNSLAYLNTTVTMGIGGVVAIIVIISIVVIIVSCKKRKSAAPTTYVHYADLDIQQPRSVQIRGRQNDLQYAEVIGVLAPKTTQVSR